MRSHIVRSSSRLANALAASVVLFLLGVAAASCENATDPSGPRPPLEAGRLVVVHSDYVSTSVSLVDPDGVELVADGLVHSGARAPGLTTALSGDVVLPSSVDPGGRLVLIDRFPNGVLTFFDVAGGEVVGQVSVATGFASNPQDVAFLGDGRAYVSRFERNPAPSGAADAFDEGDDLLVVDTVALRVVGRIPLADHVVTAAGDAAGGDDDGGDDGGEPVLARPTRFVVAADRVWVTLAALSRSFDRGAPGVVVGVDPAHDAVDRSVSIPNGANCGAVAVAPGGGALWVACSGVFQEGAERQLARSGLARIDLTSAAPAVDRWLPASDVSGRPFALEVAVDGAGRPYTVVSGDLDTGLGDRVVRLDPDTGAATVVLEGAEAFTAGGLLHDPALDRLWLALGDARDPRLLAFDTSGAEPALVGEIGASSSSGLPPRALGWLARADGAGPPGVGPDAIGGGAGPYDGLPTPDEVVSVAYGPGSGFGQDGMPGAVLDPPASGRGTGASASTDAVSLGNGGEIVLAFRAVEVVDEPGPDLVIVENVLIQNGKDERDPYAEVATVEVSEDGETWVPFPFDYAPDGEHVVDRFKGFAGLSVDGDAFDLADVGLARARYVRLRDCGAEGETDTRVFDADGEFLDDPGNACCAGESEGFDLDGVVALHWR